MAEYILSLTIVSKELEVVETSIIFPEGESLETLRLLAFSQLENESLIQDSEDFLLLDLLGRPLKGVDAKLAKFAIENGKDAKFWLVYSPIVQCSFRLFDDVTIQPFVRMIDTTYCLCSVCQNFLDPSLVVANSPSSLQESKCQSTELISMSILPPIMSSTAESVGVKLLPGSPAWLFYKRQLLRLSLEAQLTQSNTLPSSNEAVANFQRRLNSGIATVMAYEDPVEQAKVRQEIDFACILRYFREEERKQSESLRFPEDLLMTALMRWFKCDFFSWCNKPACQNPHCDGGNMSNEGMSSPTPYEQNEGGAGRVETYRCSACQMITRFPRYNNASFMCRNSRRGRCGEWANTFGMICRCLGLDTRYVLDFTDHVWVEVWSPNRGRFIHADPCERAWDAPLLYESGWNKQLTHVLCFSRYGVVDGISRYSRQLQRVLIRRASAQEQSMPEAIIQQIITTRNDDLAQRYANTHHSAEYADTGSGGGLEIGEIINRLSRGVSAFINTPDISATIAEERRTLDQYELQGLAFLLPAQKDELKENEKIGRISGDIAWRQQRGEIEIGADTENTEPDDKLDESAVLLPDGMIIPLLSQDRRICFELDCVANSSSSAVRVNGLPLLSGTSKGELRIFVLHYRGPAIGLVSSQTIIWKLVISPEEPTAIINHILNVKRQNDSVIIMKYVPSNNHKQQPGQVNVLRSFMEAITCLTPSDKSTLIDDRTFFYFAAHGQKEVVLTEDQLGVLAMKGEENNSSIANMTKIMPTAIKLWLCFPFPSSSVIAEAAAKGADSSTIEYRKMQSQLQYESSVIMTIKRNLLDITTFPVITEQDRESIVQQAIIHAEELVRRGYNCIGFTVCEQASSICILYFGSDEPFPYALAQRAEAASDQSVARLSGEVTLESLLAGSAAMSTFFRCYNTGAGVTNATSTSSALAASTPSAAGVDIVYEGWSGCYELSGGHHGDTMPFDAMRHIPVSAWPSISLAKVDLWAGVNLVNGLQLTHNIDSRVISSPLFSSTNDDPTCQQMLLSSADYEKIQQVEVRAGALVDSITLTTTTGQCLKVGGAGGEKLTMNIKTEEGQEVVGFVGGIGGHLHHLGIVLMHKNTALLPAAKSASILFQQPRVAAAPAEEEQIQAIFERYELLSPASNLGFFNVVDINEETRSNRHSGYWRQNDFEKLRLLLLLLVRENDRSAAIIALQSVIAYHQNIHKAPDQEKYQRIKLTNTVLVKKVLPVKGALSLLCYGPSAFELKLVQQDEDMVLVSRMKAIYSRPPDRVTNKAIVRWLGKYLDVLNDVLLFMQQSSR